MAIKKYLSLERLTEYDALIKAEIAEGDDSVKSYVDAEVAKKSDSEHNHDDRYYTETEVDEFLADKQASDFIVNVTENDDGTCTADKTFDELTEAYNNGKTLVCKLGGKIFTLVSITSQVIIFNYIRPSTIGHTAQELLYHYSGAILLQDYGMNILSYKYLGFNTENKTIAAAINEIHSELGEHTHDDLYYTESEIDTKLLSKSDTTHNHDSAYDVKGAADTALESAKTYADNAASTAANTVKNDLLNGAGEAYDTLKELGTLIDENVDAIDALETVAAGKADKVHTHEISEVTELQEALDTINERIGDTSVATQIETAMTDKMDVVDPTGTGSFSINRKTDTTVGAYSHAVGRSTTASGQGSHAEGWYTTASGNYSHAEGYNTTASEVGSHTEGYQTTASGAYSHAEGGYTTASDSYSHAEGYHTTANTQCQHVQGKYNILDTGDSTSTGGKYAHIVGNGTSSTARSNAHTLDWSGNAWYQGNVYVGGTSQDDASVLATKEYVDESVANITIDVDSELSDTSTNPIQNKVVKSAIDNLNNLVGDITVSDQISAAVALKSDISHTHTVEDMTDFTEQIETKLLDSQSDWSVNDETSPAYVKNRPFYSEDPVLTEVVNGTFQFQDMMGDGSLFIGLVADPSPELQVGNDIVVVFDNTEYNSTIKDMDGAPYTGNLSIMNAMGASFEDTGEPFLLMVEGTEMVMFTTNIEVEHNVIVALSIITDIKIDEKYLPDDLISKLNTATDTISTIENTVNNKIDKSNPVGTGSFSMNRKAGTTVGGWSHAVGRSTTASGNYSHAEGDSTTASGQASHAEGDSTTASGNYSHAEGYSTNTVPLDVLSLTDNDAIIASWSDSVKAFSYAKGNYSHVEGINALALNESSHAEGYTTIASGFASHAEGESTTASGYASHAEGDSTTASGVNSHAEGYKTTASGDYSHAEGYKTTASGGCSHAEGNITTASGYASHAEGQKIIASGANSHAEGLGATANTQSQHVQGEYNILDTEGSISTRGKYAHIVGNGTADDARSNAHTLDWSGNAWYQGDVYVGGTSQDDASVLATKDYVDDSVANINIDSLELITTDDIDTICGAAIYVASEVEF